MESVLPFYSHYAKMLTSSEITAACNGAVRRLNNGTYAILTGNRSVRRNFSENTAF